MFSIHIFLLFYHFAAHNATAAAAARPAPEKLLSVPILSCREYVPQNLEVVFEPVMTASPAERAGLVQKLSSDVIESFRCGLLTREEALEEQKSRGEELDVYAKING